VNDKTDNIREIPNLEKSELLGALEAIIRTAPFVAPAMKELTDAFMDAGYSEDQALKLVVLLLKNT